MIVTYVKRARYIFGLYRYFVYIRTFEKENMVEKVDLLYPIYMDIPMMISFVATMEGGYSLENSWKQTNDSSGEISGAIEGEAGLPGIISNLVKASLKASGNVDGKLDRTEESQIVFKHTEASLFMRLRHELHHQKRLVSLDEYDQKKWDTIEPSSLVEMSGEVYRSPVNEIAQLTKRWLPIIVQSSLPLNSDGNVDFSRLTPEQLAFVINISAVQAVVADLESSPLSDILLKHQGGWAKTAILDLSTKVMSLVDQELLRCGRVTVIGKVTRILAKGEKINLYRRSLLGIAADGVLNELADKFNQTPGIAIKLEASTVEYPAIEIIPMAIYV
jgi:hypothetical protein